MKISVLFLIVILITVLTSTISFAKGENKTSVKRFALVSASNNGGEGRSQLRFAESDALSISKVFQEIGGVSSTNNIILLSPNRLQLIDAIENIRDRMLTELKPSDRGEFIFYYSGHSDDTGLLLKDGSFSYKILREKIQNIGADIKIAILDSCQSGAFTRLKGGSRTSPFLINATNQIKGNVYLAASSANEASQESDAIGGSFFTHYFVSALRGASDFSGDKQVTLNEAYQYAYRETLAQTEISQAGAQHPEYNIQIVGAGDIVLTDINSSSTSLTVPDGMLGRLYVRDSTNNLVLELNKVSIKPVRIALDPNLYTIVLEKHPEIYRSDIILTAGENLDIEFDNFRLLKKPNYRTRGSPVVVNGRGRIKKNLWGKSQNQISFGFTRVDINFSDINENDFGIYDEHEIKQTSVPYEGYSIAYSRKFYGTLSTEVEFFELKGAGLIRGVSTGVKKHMSLQRKKNGDLISYYFGISPFLGRLTGLPEEYLIRSQIVRENIDVVRLGFFIPVGLQWKSKSMSIDFFTRFLGIHYRSQRVENTHFGYLITGTSLRLGYHY